MDGLQISFASALKNSQLRLLGFTLSSPKIAKKFKFSAKQMLRSGTSVAAHSREASRSISDAEFVSKLGVALQETDETQLWLELLTEECQIDLTLTIPIVSEANELIAIMTTIIRKTNYKA